MPTTVARVPLTFASFQKCSRELERGEVKRCMQRGPLPLVGYFLACPACGYSASYLDCEVGFVEEPVEIDGLAYKRVVMIERPPACFSCKRLLVIADGFFEAREP